MTSNHAQQPTHWLQNAASLAMSALLARIDQNLQARPYFWIDIRQSPPQATHSYWDGVDIAGRFVDGLLLARQMTGRADGAEAEAQLRAYLWAQQDPQDGLFYNWEDEALSSGEMSKYIPDAGVLTRLRHVDLFCQRGPLIALCTLLAAGDTTALPRWQQLVQGLWGLTERTAPDELRFPTYRWAPVLKPEWTMGASVPEKWLGYRYALLTGLARGVELTDDPATRELALGLARWYMRHGDVPADGHYAANTHSGGVLPVAVGIARLGVYTNDAEMIAWAERVYEWTRANTPDFGFLRDGLGLDGFFAGTCETCGLADLVHLALVLTQAGVADYWDDIERIGRNQLLENQHREEATLRQLYPGIDEAVLAMMHGGFECAAFPNRLLAYSGIEACCIGGGLRALYHVWRGAISETSDTTQVHLGFSRATPHVEVIGHEPWRGRIDVQMRTPRRLAIRAPGHATLEQVTLLRDGQPVKPTWMGRYANFDSLEAGQVVTLIYPLQERQANYEIAGQPYTGWWRGATMLEIQPPGEGYPIYQRRHLVTDDGAAQASTLPWSGAIPVPELPLW
ncbi:MAG: hypothetical protein NT075_32130 [Chloroflexi bacterium]|nr:hypothetical protein [Chloroflexota bacterium]